MLRMEDGCQEPAEGGVIGSGGRPSSQDWKWCPWCPPVVQALALPSRTENFLIHACHHTCGVGFTQVRVAFDH